MQTAVHAEYCALKCRIRSPTPPPSPPSENQQRCPILRQPQGGGRHGPALRSHRQPQERPHGQQDMGIPLLRHLWTGGESALTEIECGVPVATTGMCLILMATFVLDELASLRQTVHIPFCCRTRTSPRAMSRSSPTPTGSAAAPPTCDHCCQKTSRS